MDISFEVTKTADWRHRQAERFPHDARNADAAQRLEALAPQLTALADTQLGKRLSTLFSAGENEVSSAISEELRGIGFSTFPTSAAELLNDIVARAESILGPIPEREPGEWRGMFMSQLLNQAGLHLQRTDHSESQPTGYRIWDGGDVYLGSTFNLTIEDVEAFVRLRANNG